MGDSVGYDSGQVYFNAGDTFTISPYVYGTSALFQGDSRWEIAYQPPVDTLETLNLKARVTELEKEVIALREKLLELENKSSGSLVEQIMRTRKG